MPFFSVIIPSYNRASVLSRAIVSVINQSFSDWELVLVDDGSTDHTKEVVLSYSDSRIKYLCQENKGVCAARNFGVKNATADFLVFLDSDDYPLEDWLQNFYQSIPDLTIDMVFCDMQMIDSISNSSKIIKATDPYQKNTFSQDGFFMAGTFCIKTTLFNKAAAFDENIKYGEFTEFSFRLKQFNLNKKFTKKASLVYEASVNGGSKNAQNKVEALLYILKKHSIIFEQSPNVKYLYLQNIAVAYTKLNLLKNAQIYFWKAYTIQPWKLKTLVRLGISFFPIIAKRIWKETN
jgi:glycosyltransferase involved in cell wall biosynthesis